MFITVPPLDLVLSYLDTAHTIYWKRIFYLQVSKLAQGKIHSSTYNNTALNNSEE